MDTILTDMHKILPYNVIGVHIRHVKFYYSGVKKVGADFWANRFNEYFNDVILMKPV